MGTGWETAWAIGFWVALVGIAYPYLGYAPLIWLIARFRQDPYLMSDRLPTVTVLVAAYNEEDVIARKILNSLALDYPREKLEILVVTDGCTDETDAVIRRYEGDGVRLLSRSQRQGKVNALNAAIPLAKGEIVVCSDANAFFDPQNLKLLVRHFGDPRVALVAGEKRIREDGKAVSAGEGLYWRYESFLKRLDSSVSTALGATGEIFAIRRDRFEPLPVDAVIEDFVLSMRYVMQGLRVVYEPAAVSWEDASPSFGEEFKRKVRIIAGGWQSVVWLWPLLSPRYGLVAFQYVSHRVLRWMVVPFLLPFAFLANLMLAGEPLYALMLALQVSLYGAAAIGYHLQQRGIRWKLFYIPFYFVFLNVAAVLGAYRYLTGRQPVTWEKVQRA
jgi:cellulose synthase/poly-beta-1,6-N-acetylglucosamine synthase-like glycosyltransferase